jgi:hypothetical protein
MYNIAYSGKYNMDPCVFCEAIRLTVCVKSEKSNLRSCATDCIQSHAYSDDLVPQYYIILIRHVTYWLVSMEQTLQ